jgi:1-acyl-sn-glycerol-3-phosphate acyltransferase
MQKLLAWWYFTVRGWKIAGSFQYDLNKSVLVVAPHTHAFDFFLGLAIRKKMHLEFAHFLGKKELFKGVFGYVLRKLGGYPVERSKNQNQVEQVVKIFNEKEVFHIALSPEGTRKKVSRLKSGFYHIAKNANVPIVMVALDFEHKKVIFSAPFHTSDNEAADKQKIVSFFKGIKGYLPANSITEDIEG